MPIEDGPEARRNEIAAMRKRADRHRQLALNMATPVDARLAGSEAVEIERVAHAMESQLTLIDGTLQQIPRCPGRT